MNDQLPADSANEITRDSLVRILEIMHRLAAPEAMPELLREIMEVGKVAIVAEAGVLWLRERRADELIRVVPSETTPRRVAFGQEWAGVCAQKQEISNIPDCEEDDLFKQFPVEVGGLRARSLLNVPVLGQNQEILGVMQWLGEKTGQFDLHDEWVGPALAAQAAVAIQHAYMTDELLATTILKKEVAVAREIQQSTLPGKMPEVEGYDLWGEFLPTDHTGGDLYDVVILDGRLFLLLGDATGHGFGPALSATQLQAMLRVAFRLDANLDQAFMQVNNQMAEDLPDDRFITAFMGFLDPETHELEFHSAGQGPILHYQAASRECAWYKPTTFPVGIMELDGTDRAQRIAMEPGDILALISDGVYEYTNEKGGEFGERRVGDLIKANPDVNMKTLSRRLVEAARSFGAGAPQADDVTLVLVRREP